MKQLYILGYLLLFFIFASCESKEEPDYAIFMQPSSIQSLDAYADNQTFEYDDYGRIISWNCISNTPNASNSYSAHYSYPDENTIKVSSEEVLLNHHRFFEETIQLKNGRASESGGTFTDIVDNDEGTSQMRKTYRLIFSYLPSNHLNTIEHREVIGIVNDFQDNGWDNAWKWTNYLIWENGNLKEYQDYNGNFNIYQSTKYDYFEEKVAYPIIIPLVINSAHHMPLCMQGVFGLNSVSLVRSASTFDKNDNLDFSRVFSYAFEQDRISKYTETKTYFTNSVYSNPVTYTVTWTEK